MTIYFLQSPFRCQARIAVPFYRLIFELRLEPPLRPVCLKVKSDFVLRNDNQSNRDANTVANELISLGLAAYLLLWHILMCMKDHYSPFALLQLLVLSKN